ncbi:MAG: hypothetical protein BRD21_01180 [Halobacteriales archaeon SW_8_66_22]|nr:MAG: hypothetical protein BRD21_01180 [Halobacteriales archaeon SW_8_66_22]
MSSFICPVGDCEKQLSRLQVMHFRSAHDVEIKGFSTERSIKKAKSFMEEFPTYTYVVVGDEMPCNIHIPWDKRSELLEVLNDE